MGEEGRGGGGGRRGVSWLWVEMNWMAVWHVCRRWGPGATFAENINRLTHAERLESPLKRGGGGTFIHLRCRSLPSALTLTLMTSLRIYSEKTTTVKYTRFGGPERAASWLLFHSSRDLLLIICQQIATSIRWHVWWPPPHSPPFIT